MPQAWHRPLRWACAHRPYEGQQPYLFGRHPHAASAVLIAPTRGSNPQKLFTKPGEKTVLIAPTRGSNEVQYLVVADGHMVLIAPTRGSNQAAGLTAPGAPCAHRPYEGQQP